MNQKPTTMKPTEKKNHWIEDFEVRLTLCLWGTGVLLIDALASLFNL